MNNNPTALPETGGAPEKFLLLGFGEVKYTRDGIPGSFVFTAEAARTATDEFSSRGRDLVIDYEHQTLGEGKAPAAGWIDALEVTAEGLSAHVKYWTDEAKKLLSNGEYRYFSPTLVFNKDGSVKSIHSVALTNHPAIHDCPQLAASDGRGLLETLCGILRMKPLSDTSATIDMIAEKVEKLADSLERLQTEKLVSAAFAQRKISEHSRAWAEKFASEQPEAFKEWCDSAPVVVPDNSGIEQHCAERKNGRPFTDSETEIFRRLGLDPQKITL